LALAVCNETVGKSDRADELFGEALKAGPKDPAVLQGVADHCWRLGRLSDAQAHLRNLMAVSRENSPETFKLARRSLAFLLVLEGKPEKAQEALTLLDPDIGDKDAQGSATVLDRRARAQILVMQNSKEKTRKAAEILEELIDQRLASAEDFYLAAQLHDALGDWPKARKRFLDLRKPDLPGGNTPQYLATAARSLIRHGDVVEASANFEELQANPQSPLTLTHEIDARLRHSQGKTAEAYALLKEDAKSTGADLHGLAMLLAELGDHSGAESMLRQFVAQSKQPEAPLTLIYFLIKREKYGEALDLCDQFWDSSNNIAIAEACLQALNAAPADPQRIGRVEARLQTSISKSPERPRPELLVALATIRNFQNRYDEAVGLYRRVLETNPRHATALNNLAWILALQGGHGDEAVALAELAVEVTGQAPGAIDTRAVAALSLGPKGAERAIRDLELLSVENPTSTVYFHLSQAYVLAKREREARKAWQQAKAMRLTEEQLHPLELPTFHRMQKEMD
jgi:tetratricopeptide (TPR) repeat protein